MVNAIAACTGLLASQWPWQMSEAIVADALRAAFTAVENDSVDVGGPGTSTCQDGSSGSLFSAIFAAAVQELPNYQCLEKLLELPYLRILHHISAAQLWLCRLMHP